MTFTTPGDCSACQPHLAGLDLLDRSQAWPVPHIYVSYTTKATRNGASREYKRVLHEPVCWDEGGALWTANDIRHTPVTALLRDGYVVLLHDAPLAAHTAMQRLLDTIAVVGRTR
ncbi:MAG: hypothetical protein U9Q74_00110 [Gemmatimonadota bacterium]|nr:hypothetical protein [Gemmatimonadota bacterium]